ncbi:MAG: carbohydrate binding family 9 domain-containing protein [Gemmatimonadaceae bacterium]|nr:carbohydrate binding family 9 domain-containing protein [Gemmatimonadaceae bacterium]
MRRVRYHRWVGIVLRGTLGALAGAPLMAPRLAGQYPSPTQSGAPQRDSAAAPSWSADDAGAILRPRTLVARRIAGTPPRIDGRLDDRAWSSAPVATDFVQQGPHPGAPATLRTEARVLFDDHAVYVAVRAFEPPENVVAPYPRRDDEARSDWIFVEIDSRHDRRTAYSLGINARGVQVDGLFFDDINYDYAWNGVWEGAARIDSLGWAAEYRIPFSQLPYGAPHGAGGDDSTLTWGFNVYRRCARIGESSDWSPRLPTYAGVVSHFNDLVGIVPPHAPTRLEVVPYTAMTATHAPPRAGDPFRNGVATDPSAGADMQFRITPALTLSAAVHPDFGQVEADPSEVNLTTFETFFTERRPLFVEGANVFQFNAGLPFTTRGNTFSSEQPFYSRRIGRPPHGSVPAGARFSDVPASATLLGAAKLSGRTADGWSIGALGALTDAEDARFVDAAGNAGRVRVEPRTVFGVARVAKDFRNGGSAIGAIATVVDRGARTASLDSIVAARAMAAGVDGRHRFGADGAYEVSGFALGSRVEGSAAAMTALRHAPTHFFQRPDAGHLHDDTTSTSLSGFAAQGRVAKIGGAWHWSLVGHAISPGFEVNDVGFQRNADWLLATATVAYQRYQAGHFIRRWSVGSNQLGVGWSFGGERRAAVVNANASADFRSYWSASLSVDQELSALSTEMLRGGPALLLPPRQTLTANVTTDTRKSLQVALDATLFREPGTSSHEVSLAPTVAWRAVDRLALTLTPAYTRLVNGWQYVGQPRALGVPHYVLARLDETTVSLTTRVDYAFAPTLTLQLYAQPFVSAGRYGRFAEVRAPRAARPEERVVPYAPAQLAFDAANRVYAVDLDTDGTADFSFGAPDFNRKELNVNAVLRWEYRPGSTLYVVWSQERHGELADGSFALGRDAGRLFAIPPTNMVLVKASYWLPL